MRSNPGRLARDLRANGAVHSVAQASVRIRHLANLNNTAAWTTSVFCRSSLGTARARANDMGCAQIYDAFTPRVITGLRNTALQAREGGP